MFGLGIYSIIIVIILYYFRSSGCSGRASRSLDKTDFKSVIIVGFGMRSANIPNSL